MNFWKHYYGQRNFIYHYTSKENAESILKSMRIYTCKSRVPYYGEGVFLTKKSPQSSTNNILFHTYRGNPKYESQLECAFAINENHIDKVELFDPKYPERSIWKSREDIDLNSCLFFIIFREMDN